MDESAEPRQGWADDDEAAGGARRKRESPHGARRRARELALAVLFEAATVGHPAGEVLARQLEAAEADAATAARARELVTGVLRHQAEIDARIAAAAPTWPLAQMPGVEISILRVALFEILFDNAAVPLRAAISEAVELAKVFGSDSAPRFVNGVLSTIVSRAGEQPAAGRHEPAAARPEERHEG